MYNSRRHVHVRLSLMLIKLQRLHDQRQQQLASLSRSS